MARTKKGSHRANGKGAGPPAGRMLTLAALAEAARLKGAGPRALEMEVLAACLDDARLVFREVRGWEVRAQLEFLLDRGWSLARLRALVEKGPP